MNEEKEEIKVQAAASKGQNLEGINQFEKQANDVEFMDYNSRALTMMTADTSKSKKSQKLKNMQ